MKIRNRIELKRCTTKKCNWSSFKFIYDRVNIQNPQIGLLYKYVNVTNMLISEKQYPDVLKNQVIH